MTQIELDKGILERLMSCEETNAELLTAAEQIKTEKQTETQDTLTEDDVFMPIVQVINIQNIATSAFLSKYNTNNSNSNHNNINNSNKSRKSDGDDNNETDTTTANTTTTKETSQQKDLGSTKSTLSDRYLLILSDGEFYETRCLLLPNLNYLVITLNLHFEFSGL